MSSFKSAPFSNCSRRSLGKSSCGDIPNEYDKKVGKHRHEVRKSAIIHKMPLFEEPPLRIKVNRIVQGHLMSVRDSNIGRQKHSYIEDQAIIKKRFGRKKRQGMKYITNHASGWTNRAMDWYNSERRIIFATNSE